MHEGIGYGNEPLEWRFDPIVVSSRPSLVTFEKEQKLIGDRIYELVNAAKRLDINSPSTTIVNTIQALRVCARAIATHAPNDRSVAGWHNATIFLLTKDASLAESSKWTYCNNIARLLDEVSRFQSTEFSSYNPFERQDISHKALLHGTALEPLIEHARRDVLAKVQAFQSPDPSHVPFIDEARELAKSGLFIPGSGNVRPQSPMALLTRRWKYATGLALPDLTFYLYPSPWDLIPFLILLSYKLAANPDALCLLTRDAIEPYLHPTKGKMLIVTLRKPRGEVPQYQLLDAGTLSNGWLLRNVLKLTQPLLSIAGEKSSNAVFLAATNYGTIRPLNGSLRSLVLNRYLAKFNLPITTFKALRPARMTDEWIRTRDPYRVWRLGGQKSMTMAASYVLRKESEKEDAKSIASVQHLIAHPEQKALRQTSSSEAGVLPSHTCKNPRDPARKADEEGFCASYLWPFNDPHFVFQLEPRPVAYLLRDYQVLCEAQRSLSRDRFANLYAAKKRKIETDYLPEISDELRETALALIPSLPAAPRIDAL
jgi:hypothetical protein